MSQVPLRGSNLQILHMIKQLFQLAPSDFFETIGSCCRAQIAEAYILHQKKGAYLEGYAASLRPIAGKNQCRALIWLLQLAR